MQLTKHTDYAFRILLFLAVSPREELVTARHIAETYNMAYNHVNKVVNKLSSAGLIESVRGRQGGLRIRPEALDSTAADLIRLTAEVTEPANCTNPLCVIAPSCTLRSVLSEAQNKFLEHLDQYTIADLVAGKEHELVVALKIEPTNSSISDA